MPSSRNTRHNLPKPGPMPRKQYGSASDRRSSAEAGTDLHGAARSGKGRGDGSTGAGQLGRTICRSRQGRDQGRRSPDFRLDLRLARTDVKTPVTGVVSARNAKVGAIANGTRRPAVHHHSRRRGRNEGRCHRVRPHQACHRPEGQSHARRTARHEVRRQHSPDFADGRCADPPRHRLYQPHRTREGPRRACMPMRRSSSRKSRPSSCR